MKRLLIVFAVLIGVATAAVVLAIVLSRRGRFVAARRSVLTWHLDGSVAELGPTAPFHVPGYEPPASLAKLYTALAGVRNDPSIQGIAVYIGRPHIGLGKAQEFRRQLQMLRTAGKFVRCYLDTAGEGSNGTLAYYLATACGEISLAPSGEVNLLGLYSDATFLRGTLDKLKVEPVYLHVGKYKSASETFTETQHSPAAREAIAAVLDSYYDQIVSAIAEARHLAPAQVEGIIDGAPYDAAKALELHLVDAVAYPDEFRDKLKKASGREPAWTELEDYTAPHSFGGREIAVVVAEGAIIHGRGGVQPWGEDRFLGSSDLEELCRRLAEDDSVAAVVLRIDSPGGSALASDLILRQVQKLGEKKPVVVSMSDVAASGGYYIAARAKKIVAEAGTLTGSIGVVAGKLATRRFQQELLGITHDGLKRGANADYYSPLDGFTAEQSARFEQQMRRVYATFLGHVAQGRHLPAEAVEAVAGGRVWTGADAKKFGLVDELGGIDKALELARAAAALPADQKTQIVFYPEAPSFLAYLLGRGQTRVPAQLGEILRRFDGAYAPGTLELPPELARLSAPY